MQNPAQGLGLVLGPAGSFELFHKSCDLYQRCVCVCVSAFNTKSQAGYQNDMKVGIYNVVTAACVT